MTGLARLALAGLLVLATSGTVRAEELQKAKIGVLRLSSSARVSGACFAMGEAAGSAAALALSGNTIPRDIAVEKLQQALQQHGAFIGRDQNVPIGL